jgi:5-methylcytosine-specific restriction enzyme A
VSLSFSGFCAELGAPLYNKAWSWCSISPENRLALFTVWEHEIHDSQYIFTTHPRLTDVRKKPGRKELISVLDRVIQNGYSAYGIKCRAADIDAVTRKRASFESLQLLDLRIRKRGDDYIGQIVGFIPPEVVQTRGAEAIWRASTAINDIDQDDVGNDDPEYRKRMSGSYIRDAKVRELVLKRAGGICEECSQPGFVKRNGKRYLETHHVISLSEQGVDKAHNVIALCATDHRRAHFAENWKELQDKFLAKLNKYKSEN